MREHDLNTASSDLRGFQMGTFCGRQTTELSCSHPIASWLRAGKGWQPPPVSVHLPPVSNKLATCGHRTVHMDAVMKAANIDIHESLTLLILAQRVQCQVANSTCS